MPSYDTALLIKVAEMHFYKGISQKEIGQMLSISPTTVSRLLKEGYASKIIRVQIADINSSYDEIGDAIKKSFHLESVTIVDTPSICDNALIKKSIGQAAKNVLASVLFPKAIVGVGVGGTIWEMISSFKRGEIPYNINVVSLMGGWSDSTSLNAESFSILYKMAQTLGCQCKALLSPSILASSDLKKQLMAEPEIRKVTDFWPRLDVAVFGIGPSIELSSHSSFYGTDMEDVTGDICGWPITAKGKVFQTELNDHLMAIYPKLLKEVPIRIGIGGGSSKCANTISALKGGFITHLVTDYETGKYIKEYGGAES